MRKLGQRGTRRIQLICLLCAVLLVCALGVLCSCTDEDTSGEASETEQETFEVSDIPYEDDEADATKDDKADEKKSDKDAKKDSKKKSDKASKKDSKKKSSADADKLRSKLNLTEDYRDSFVHGKKSAKYQKYIVLHDTETNGSAEDVVNSWDSSGEGVAAHFVVDKDGGIVQCVDVDTIAHHAGFGDAGHNDKFGVDDESRDDKVGTTPIGDSYPDYGMNSYSVGIELVNNSDGDSEYPEKQLEALDNLIAYIDAYYGFESETIDHKTWRTSNSDTSAEFSDYLASYQKSRKHA